MAAAGFNLQPCRELHKQWHKASNSNALDILIRQYLPGPPNLWRWAVVVKLVNHYIGIILDLHYFDL